MTLSRGETIAMVKRAARGAGYSWGMAEEIAMACATLCAQGVNAQPQLSQFLKSAQGRVDKLALQRWPVNQDDVCPFSLGCYLVESGQGADEYILPNVWGAVFLIPFLQRLAGVRNQNFHMEAGTSACDIGADYIAGCVDLGASGHVKITTQPRQFAPLIFPPAYPDKYCDVMEYLGEETLVPDSETSRAKGAGA